MRYSHLRATAATAVILAITTPDTPRRDWTTIAWPSTSRGVGWGSAVPLTLHAKLAGIALNLASTGFAIVCNYAWYALHVATHQQEQRAQGVATRATRQSAVPSLEQHALLLATCQPTS